ncbi:MAG TPA: hypothetical protein PLH94_05060 [Fimbriimonadaceae bacterium]|nr:hypothetical protein [Fimbriimonadaceae bacterium]
MSPPRFLLACVLIAVLYGIAHDLVTAHVAIEYFTVHHPRLVDSDSPIVMALLWGFLATFWVGGIAGLVLLAVSRWGRAPQLNLRRVLRSYTWLAVASLFLAMITIPTVLGLAETIPAEKRRPTYESDRRLVAVGMAHAVSYGAATWLTAGLAGWIVLKRYRLSRQAGSAAPGGDRGHRPNSHT